MDNFNYVLESLLDDNDEFDSYEDKYDAIDSSFVTLESLILDADNFVNMDIATEGVIDRIRGWREKNKVKFNKIRKTFLSNLSQTCKASNKLYTAKLKRQRNGKKISPKKLQMSITSYYTLSDIKQTAATAEKLINVITTSIDKVTSKSPEDFNSEEKFTALIRVLSNATDTIRKGASTMKDTKVIQNKRAFGTDPFSGLPAFFDLKFINEKNAKTLPVMDYLNSFKEFSSFIESTSEKLIDLIEDASYNAINKIQSLIEKSDASLKQTKKNKKAGTATKEDIANAKYAKKAISVMQKYVYSRISDLEAIYSIYKSMATTTARTYFMAVRAI